MAKQPKSLNGKVVAITGGARGIGKATAQALVYLGELASNRCRRHAAAMPAFYPGPGCRDTQRELGTARCAVGRSCRARLRVRRPERRVGGGMDENKPREGDDTPETAEPPEAESLSEKVPEEVSGEGDTHRN